MYGKPRTASSYSTRLLTSIDSGTNQFTVDTGLDWVAGEEIAVLTNTLDATTTEYFEISDYNDLTGVVTVTVSA